MNHPFDRPPIADFTDEHLVIKKPMEYAVGIEAVEKAMLPAEIHLGTTRMMETALTMNHKKGFDCPSCAWANPDHSKVLEFCENGIKNIVWDDTPLTIPDEFWVEHSLTSMLDKSEYWLGRQGRIAKPMYKAADSDHYQPISWDEAFDKIADKLRELDDPNEAVFYLSGRIMNEPAYLYQLFGRMFGTNNLPDCSNMCHEATGAGMSPAIGVGKASISVDDFKHTELIIAMGHNPGTNHPRSLNSFEEAKHHGAEIVAVNPLREASLLRYKNPQQVSGELGEGTKLADQYVQLRGGGDQLLIQALAKRVLLAEQKAPGTVLDHEFIQTYCEGFEAYRDAMLTVDDELVLRATGLDEAEIDELAERYIRSNATIISWALGITQQKQGTAVIAEIMNLLFLRGNIGKPGAGASPFRGHSNVQGDRTMGVWENLTPALAASLKKHFGFTPPTESGFDSVDSMNALDEGKIKFFMSLGGNLVAAMSDSARSDSGIRSAELSVQVATKLNRSHVVTAAEALLLPTYVRAERDEQASGSQFVTSEDTYCRINMSHGDVDPVTEHLKSDVSIICELGRRLFSESHPQVNWQAFEDDYDTIRDAIAATIPGFEDFNQRIKKELSFVLPHPPRDSRTFPTRSGKAQFTLQSTEVIDVPEGRLLLSTMRAHDQHNTTIYGLDDRYRGVHKGRLVVFVNPDDLTALGFADGDTVDVFSEWPGEPDRVLRGYRAVAYPVAKGCAALYFPEGNVLVPRASVDPICNTPASKQVIVRLEQGAQRAQTGRPVSV